MMAAGRARSLLAFGSAHFAVYVGSVIVVAHLGLTAVAIDATVVHGTYLILAYAILFRGAGERTLAGLWRDVGPATTCCAVMAGAMLLTDWLTVQAAMPVFPRLACIGAAGTLFYALTLKAAFADGWADLVTLARKLVPPALTDRLRALRWDRLRALGAGRTP
jgi:hypothetical protein